MTELLSRDAFAQAVSLSLDSLDRAIARGEVKTVRIGRRVLIPRAELDRLIESAR